MSRGLIEQALNLGLEREEISKDHPRALIGGERIPYPPKDLASLTSILSRREIKSMLALEGTTDGAVKFLESHLQIPKVIRVPMDRSELKKTLRNMAAPVDLITLDGRGLPLDADTIWKYIEGGKSPYAKEWAKGAPVDYGIPKLKPGTFIVINLADPACKALWFAVRSRHMLAFQSPFVGMAYTSFS